MGRRPKKREAGGGRGEGMDMEKPHKKLDVWKLSMDLACRIYRATEAFPRGEQYSLSLECFGRADGAHRQDADRIDFGGKRPTDVRSKARARTGEEYGVFPFRLPPYDSRHLSAFGIPHLK